MADAPKVPASPKDRTDSMQRVAQAPVVDEIAEPISVPTPMADAMELSNVDPMTGKRYPNKRQMKYGGAVMYSNGPRKVRT